MRFETICVTRTTAETEFAVKLRPRTGEAASLPIANRLLSHFIDHFQQAGGVEIELVQAAWPGSWQFDHVLCEDLGQLIGRGLATLHERLASAAGVPGRANAVCCMDDSEAEVTLSFEGRPAAAWSIPGGADIDGFVDSWYDEGGRQTGQAFGTNLRQFLDGFALGAGAGVSVVVRRTGNLHHLYETVFRALGDAVGSALGTSSSRLPGDTSGLARRCVYSVRSEG